jgi:hypothetical protein
MIIKNFDKIVYDSFSSTIQKIVPNINIKKMVYRNFPNQSLYMKNKKITCTNNSEIYYAMNNPKLSRLNWLVFNDIYIQYLGRGSFNYVIYKNTIHNTFHITYGRVTNDAELGVKHSIISRGFPIYLAGELSLAFDKFKKKNIIKYSFNSSNFKIKIFRKKIYEHLIINKSTILNYQDIIDKYKLDKSEFDINEIDLTMDEYADILHLFYEDFIKPFAENIFIKISGFNEDTYLLEYVISEQDVYYFNKNEDYYIGLHNYYYDNNECYDKKIINEINELRNAQNEHIGRLCIQTNDNINCPYDNENNKYDILDELFIQLIYQWPLLKRDKCKMYKEKKFNCNWQGGKQEIFDDINYLLKDNEFDITQDIKFHFNKWFCRYITVNYKELSLYVCDNEELSSIDILSCNLKIIIKNEILLIKLLFYYYLRLIIPINYEECKIKKLDKIVKRAYKLTLNKEEFYLTFSFIYIPILDYSKIYYDYSNSYQIYDNNKLINIKDIIFDKHFKVPNEPFITIVTDAKNLPIPKPILTINYKKKYLKYKSKYLKIKNN